MFIKVVRYTPEQRIEFLEQTIQRCRRPGDWATFDTGTRVAIHVENLGPKPPEEANRFSIEFLHDGDKEADKLLQDKPEFAARLDEFGFDRSGSMWGLIISGREPIEIANAIEHVFSVVPKRPDYTLSLNRAKFGNERIGPE